MIRFRINAILCIAIALTSVLVGACSQNNGTQTSNNVTPGPSGGDTTSGGGTASGSGTASTPDTTPPTYAGAVTATAMSASSIQISLGSATDNKTSSSGIVFLICQSTTAGACQTTFATTYTSSAGAGTFLATGLTQNTLYYFVARAQDQAGNLDTNTTQRSATTLDGAQPTFAGLTSATANGTSQIDLTWSAASDNVTSAGNMVYKIYQASTPGGQNFTTATYTTSAGATTYSVTGLSPNTAYYFVVRARDLALNEDTNGVERTATTAPDTTAPTFSGLVSATDNASGPSIALSWSAASDTITPSGSIVYDICRSTTAGTCTSSFSTTATTSAGATNYNDSGLARFTTYYYVVRARDAAGNRDTNTMQVSAATTIANTWTTKTAMPTARFWHTCSASSTQIYAIGGKSGSTTLPNVEAYDPVGNSWTTLAALPSARSQVASAFYSNKIYVFGGHDGTSATSTVYEYNIAGNTWALKTAMPFAATFVSANTVGSKIYVQNGNALREYDPGADTWTNCGGSCANMLASLFAVASVAYSGKAYVFGGENTPVAMDTIFAYNTGTNAWSMLTNMPGYRATATAQVLSDNRAYVIGGWTGAGTPTNSNYQYTFATDSWVTKAGMPSFRDGLCSGVVNNKIYVIGGGNGGALSVNEEFQ